MAERTRQPKEQLPEPVSISALSLAQSLAPGHTLAQGSVKVNTVDPLDTEFRYYSKLIQELVLMLSDPGDKEAVVPWIHKLSGPGYSVSRLRDKRNRYMLMLCMSLIINSVEGPFIFEPPIGILQNLTDIDYPPKFEYDYDKDTTWEDQLKVFRDLENMEGVEPPKKLKCSIHTRFACPQSLWREKHLGDALDKQFRYLLYLMKPYAAILYRNSDRIRAAKWMQALCSIDQNYCTFSKGMRNDYMMVLGGHIANQDLIGPFESFPLDKLIPIHNLAKLRSEKKPITDPTHPTTIEAFMDAPSPDEGAFAFIACTGDLYQSKYGS